MGCEGLDGLLPKRVPGTKPALASVRVQEIALPGSRYHAEPLPRRVYALDADQLCRAPLAEWLWGTTVLPRKRAGHPLRGRAVDRGGGPVPVSKPDLIATGRIQKDGSFSLTTPSHGEGVLEGTCTAAVVVESRQGKPVIDERFADFDTSDLQFTVTARSENYFIVEVSRGGSLPGRTDPARKGRR